MQSIYIFYREESAGKTFEIKGFFLVYFLSGKKSNRKKLLFMRCVRSVLFFFKLWIVLIEHIKMFLGISHRNSKLPFLFEYRGK